VNTHEIKGLTKKAVRTALFFAPSLYRSLTSEYRYRTLYRLKRGHEPELRHVAPFLPEAPLVLDIGGNIGQSVLSVMACIPDARIVSFEPNPGPRAVLSRLAGRFPGQVEVRSCGLGDREATNLLYIPTYRGKEMPGLASFDRAEAHDWISDQTVFLFDESKLTIASLPVETMPLDDLDYEPDLIKIDVQGFEHEVVRGALATIDRSQPIIVAEAPAPELVELLAQHGYSVVEYNGMAIRPSNGTQANQIFLPARFSPSSSTGP
jgi:FkbM family methyltransferase